MPRSNRVVDADWSLLADLRSYYRGSIVTYVDSEDTRWCFNISEIHQRGNGMFYATGNLLGRDGQWLASAEYDWEMMDLTLPRLGMVEVNNCWFFIQRAPARRMRKGYHWETITYTIPEGMDDEGEVNVIDPRVLAQIWYGTPRRYTNHIVRHGDALYYTTEKIANFTPEGVAVLIPGKEKMGEMVCKQLSASNWEFQVLRPNDPTQASSQPTDSA